MKSSTMLMVGRPQKNHYRIAGAALYNVCKS